MDIAQITTLAETIAPVAALVGSAGAFAWRKMSAMSRTITALERAIAHQDAQNRAVVLVLTYPRLGLSAVPLMRVWGWQIAEYTMQDGEILPDTDQFRADLKAADAVVLQGTTATDNAAIMRRRDFRDVLGGGVGVISVVPDQGTRYDQSLFGMGDQSTTTPPTTEAAVRASIARSWAYKTLQGVRPGGLADARKALVG